MSVYRQILINDKPLCICELNDDQLINMVFYQLNRMNTYHPSNFVSQTISPEQLRKFWMESDPSLLDDESIRNDFVFEYSVLETYLVELLTRFDFDNPDSKFILAINYLKTLLGKTRYCSDVKHSLRMFDVDISFMTGVHNSPVSL